MSEWTSRVLRKLRQDRNLSQLELAEELNRFSGTDKFKMVTISKWENGVIPRTSSLSTLARYYNVTEEYLLVEPDNSFELAGKGGIRKGDLVKYNMLPVVYRECGRNVYAIVNADEGFLVFGSGERLPFESIKGEVFSINYVFQRIF